MTELRRWAATMAVPLGSVAALSSVAAVGAAKAARIEIDVVGRRNACALLGSLVPYRSFLVQHGAEQWVVHAQTPGCHGEDTGSAIAAIEECVDEHGIAKTSIRIDGRRYRPAAGSAL